MNLHQQALQWAKQYLIEQEQSRILSDTKIVETAYSIVYKIETTKQTVYLKQVPQALFLEPDTLLFLHQQSCKNIPEILAIHRTLRCFIMSASGDISLRHSFKELIHFDQLAQGIEHYTTIQRALENKTEQLSSLGLPDWRLNRFPSLFQQLLQQHALLVSDGLTEQEMTQLHNLHSVCAQHCDFLSKYVIPETINHCDFQENNMLLDKKTGGISIIDWGETVVTHPFFSLNSCLWNLTYFHKLKPSDALYHRLKVKCVEPWLPLYEEKTLLTIFNTSNELLGIYAALTYQRMYAATINQSQTVQQQHLGSIAGCLRTFLKDNK